MLVEKILILGETYYRIFNKQREHIATLNKHFEPTYSRLDYIDKMNAIQEMVIHRQRIKKNETQKTLPFNR